jgi:TolB-like protein/tetratricopeptide (TPR) repeat protein
MAEFFAELKRRHIYRVGAAYVVVAWALAQGVDMLSQVFELPGWIARPAVILLAVGFPLALVAAWMIESKPHATVAAAVRSKPTILDWTLLGALAFVVLLMGYQQLAPSSDAPTQQTGVDQVKQGSLNPGAAISLAVLPFANLSGDPSQEFFSDGMTEEITAALAKIPDLRVVGRTSAFQFKGQSQDLRAIGQSLSATHLIEGSVRRAGERVRITAQLIDANDGTHVWTENYDRQLTDIFAIQEDIATAIAAALRVPLDLQPGGTLVSNRSVGPEPYERYLRAKALVRARGAGGRQAITDATALLEPIVTEYPDFAPAWAEVATAYGLTPNFHPARNSGSVEELRRVVDVFVPKAEAAARRAIQLDPKNAEAHVNLAYMQQVLGKLLLAEDLYEQALAIEPSNPDALHAYSLQLVEVGRVKEAVAMRQRLQALEPFVPTFNQNAAAALWLNGQTDAAIAILKDLPLGGNNIRSYAAMMYASAGRYGEAADALLSIPSGTYPPGTVETAARILRTAPTTAASPQDLPPLGNLGFVYLYVGAPNRVLEYVEFAVEARFLSGPDPAFLWHPSYAPVRKTERFKAFVRKAGMVEYWRARGWPEFCRPTTGDDFICD